jgi:hypothetical protein
VHPLAQHVLQFFAHEHLPAELAEVVEPFQTLASTVADGPDNPETTAALRKLLEAKDCAVRAVVADLAPGGGHLPQGGMAFNDTGRSEAVLSPDAS